MVTQTELFGEIPQETKGLKKSKEPKKRKATITLSYGATTDEARGIKNGERFISVDFEGHNEGSCGGHNTEQEALAEVKRLLERYKEEYSIEIIDKRFEKS